MIKYMKHTTLVYIPEDGGMGKKCVGGGFSKN